MSKKRDTVLTVNPVEALEKYQCLFHYKIPEHARQDKVS